MPTAATDNTLSKCPLFRGMNSAERQEIIPLLEGKSYAPGTTIISEGESHQHIWIILQGRCHVTKKARSGEARELWILDPGGVFGEMSFFNPAPHSATVQATTEVELAHLSREKFEPLLHRGSVAAYKLAFNTMGVLIERLRKIGSPNGWNATTPPSTTKNGATFSRSCIRDGRFDTGRRPGARRARNPAADSNPLTDNGTRPRLRPRSSPPEEL
jgi:CRP/FNR family transcriptional regulator, cyclic AMP receptor protein